MKQNFLSEIFEKFMDELNLKKGKCLGSGGFGLVNEVIVRYINKEFAGKLIKRDNKIEFNEQNLIKEFRGPNIVRINKIYNKRYYNNEYSLILMEKAQLKDLGEFINYLSKKNLLKLIYYPFKIIGDNLIRFFIKQIVECLEFLYRNNFCHFDIKPGNILIFLNIILKLSDFDLLRDLNEIKDADNNVKIPGGTLGYISPEFYFNHSHEVSYEESIKYDFFSLGATIFYLNFGKRMLNYKILENNLLTANYIFNLLDKAMNEIKSEKLSDKDFIEFLCSLIQFKPKYRPNFEEIYRNKWLNRNWEEILEIHEINDADEEKLILELDKSDFLFEKKKYVNKMRNNNEKYYKNINNDIKKNFIHNNITIKKEKNAFHKHKFILKI